MLPINQLKMQYEDAAYQACLERLYASLGDKDAEAWATQIYLSLRDDPSNEHLASLNMDRKVCLKLIYELVDAWEDSQDPEAFEQDILSVFEVQCIKRVLDVCMPMDKAQSLYRMQIATSRFVGMHWFCKRHLEENTPFAQAHPQEQANLKSWLEGYEGFGTMNKRLFKLMYTDSFKLMQDPCLARCARPAKATFVEVPAKPFDPQVAKKRALRENHTLPEPKRALVQKDPAQQDVQKFVVRYEERSFQNKLRHMYQDKGSQDPGTWATDLYQTFARNHRDARALALNQDRKDCLDLLYDLVEEWQTKYNRSAEYEQAILDVFKKRRLLRILGVCLVMDRAQCLHKMILPTGEVGMHWFCDYHFQDETDTISTPEECGLWRELLRGYSGTATMNKKLYLLLFSETLGLQEQEPLLSGWTRPVPAPA